MAKRKNVSDHHHMLLLGLSALTLIASVLIVNVKSSQAGPDLLSGKELVKKNCDTTGSPVINVTQKVVNSIDSGIAGNYWAFDDFNRKIQVWKQVDNSFCALVDYEGKFNSQEGQISPGNTGVLTGKEDGTFKGGYRGKITGTMKATPDLSTKGSIGTVDYHCDLVANCPGAFDWMSKYFATGATGFTFNYQWWGWEYKYQNKTWVNSSDGNSGDII